MLAPRAPRVDLSAKGVTMRVGIVGLGTIVVGEFGRFTIHLENEPSDTNPRTGKLTYLSTVALLKALGNPLKVGT
jgi:hypothetical protein